MNIKEFAKMSGIPVHTLRFYEKVGIFHKIERNASGHRVFTKKDLSWAEFIHRLKDTAMPLEQIKQYALLRQQGDSTIQARKKLLESHAAFLKRKIAGERQNLRKLEEKIKYYEKLILEQKSS